MGTRSNPVPLGQPANVGNGWIVKITGVYPNAWPQIQGANEFNPPPPPGYQDFMIAAQGNYVGPGSSHLDSGFSFRAVGSRNVAYTTFDNPTCGVLPEPDLYLTDPQVFTGGIVTGNAACWVVTNADAATLVAFFHPFLTDTDIFFALR